MPNSDRIKHRCILLATCKFEKLGDAINLVALHFVKPFIQVQKSDSNDVKNIAIAFM